MVKKLGNSENYSYNFRWSIKNEDGTVEHFRIRRCAHVSNKKDALLVEAAHKQALALGLIHRRDPWPPPKEPAPPTLRAFAPDFLQHVKTNKKPGTHRFYQGGLGRLLAFSALADAPLNAIKAETVDRYSRYRLEVAKNSPITVNGDLRALRRALKLAMQWGRLKADEAVAVNELPEGPSTRRALSPKEEQLYLRHASPNLRDGAIVAVDSGLRPEELLPLLWTNVDLLSRAETPNGVIHVRGEGKSDAAIRSVPLTPRAQEVLQRRKKAAEAGLKQSPYVFPGNGDTGHIVSLQHPHEEAIKKAKLKPFEFYCHRHTFGTRAAMAGMDKFALCKLMGHSSPSVTERYYIHVTTEHVAAGFEKFVVYSERGTAEGIAAAFPQTSDAVQ
jgi:integrase